MSAEKTEAFFIIFDFTSQGKIRASDFIITG